MRADLGAQRATEAGGQLDQSIAPARKLEGGPAEGDGIQPGRRVVLEQNDVGPIPIAHRKFIEQLVPPAAGK